MKVMTYNIRLGIQQGVDAIARVIRDAQPDLVALQEVGQSWRMGPAGDTTAELAARTDLAHFQYVATIFEPPAHRYGHALLCRWPIEVLEVFQFSRHIDEPRAALVARIQTPSGALCVIATHLSHLSDERARQSPQLLELVQRTRAAAPSLLLLGDLNEEPSAAWMRTLESQLVSATRLAAGATFPNPVPTQRIDHVLVDGATILAAAVLTEPDASDHRPLTAQIRLRSAD